MMDIPEEQVYSVGEMSDLLSHWGSYYIRMNGILLGPAEMRQVGAPENVVLLVARPAKVRATNAEQLQEILSWSWIPYGKIYFSWDAASTLTVGLPIVSCELCHEDQTLRFRTGPARWSAAGEPSTAPVSGAATRTAPATGQGSQDTSQGLHSAMPAGAGAALTPGAAELLTMLAEEAAEVIQAATKILRFGWESPEYDNRGDLMDELGQMETVVLRLRDMGAIGRIPIRGVWERMLPYTKHQER